jgi:hypothetical protein
MTTVNTIMTRARLQAAAEQAWREAIHLHKADAWQKHDEYNLALFYFHTLIVTMQPDADQLPEIPIIPRAICKREMTVLGVRIIVTAPMIDPEWFWIACRFHWRHGYERNYTDL